jgi:hypothetical protein
MSIPAREEFGAQTSMQAVKNSVLRNLSANLVTDAMAKNSIKGWLKVQSKVG